MEIDGGGEFGRAGARLGGSVERVRTGADRPAGVQTTGRDWRSSDERRGGSGAVDDEQGREESMRERAQGGREEGARASFIKRERERESRGGTTGHQRHQWRRPLTRHWVREVGEGEEEPRRFPARGGEPARRRGAGQGTRRRRRGGATRRRARAERQRGREEWEEGPWVGPLMGRFGQLGLGFSSFFPFLLFSI
jgi:hypothetical protein